MKNLQSSLLNLAKLEKLLFFLTVLFLPTQLGKHFWPSSSFIYSLRIDYLSPAIYFWDLLVIALVLTWFSQIILQKYYSHAKTKSYINHKFLFLLLFFFLTQAMSVLNASNPEGSLVRLKEYFFAASFALYISSQNFSKIKNLFFSSLIISILFTCLLATSQFLLGKSLGFWILGERDFSVSTPLIARFNFYDQVFLRPYATFSHPNMLAAFLLLTFPIAVFGLPKKLTRFKLFLGLMAFITIFITFSRAGLVLMVIQSTILFRRFWKLLLILGIIIAPLIFVRLASIFTFDTLAVLRREQLSDYAIKTFLEHPLAGVGVNNFINVLAADEVLVGTSRFLQPVHNIFLLILSETGALGFLGTSMLLFYSIGNDFKSKNKFSKIILGNLFMLIFLGFFDHYFLTLPQGQRLFFMLLGLSFRRN